MRRPSAMFSALSVLAGHSRYAHMTALRCDPVNPPLLGMKEVVSEDAVQRGLDKIEEDAGAAYIAGKYIKPAWLRLELIEP